jgi:hypothetical protein
MGAALAVATPAARFGVGQGVWLAGSEGRPPVAVTVRDAPSGSEPRYRVTLDDGLCNGLSLWAADAELSARHIGRPERRA